MLRTNLSTRPFYNERAVVVALGAVAIVLAVITALTLNQLFALHARAAALTTDVSQAERRATDLRQRAARIRASVDPGRLEAVANAAHEANALIDGRTFSWTELFNRFEATLPADVRITSVKPSVAKDGRFIVSMTVVGRSVEDVDDFIEKLEATKAFSDVLSRDERTTEEGLIESAIEGTYLPAGRAVVEAGGTAQ